MLAPFAVSNQCLHTRAPRACCIVLIHSSLFVEGFWGVLCQCPSLCFCCEGGQGLLVQETQNVGLFTTRRCHQRSKKSAEWSVHSTPCAVCWCAPFSLRVHAFSELGSLCSNPARRQFCAVHAWLASRPSWLLACCTTSHTFCIHVVCCLVLCLQCILGCVADVPP